MSRCRVVAPKTTRLPLSDGDFLDVTAELNAGEYFDLLGSLVDRKPFSKPLAYIVGWSLVGLDGKPLPYDLDLPEDTRRATLRSLDKATMREIVAAIDKHEAAEEKANDAKKKDGRYRARVIQNAILCRAMGGWRYEWVDALPRAVYDLLLEDLNRVPTTKE